MHVNLETLYRGFKILHQGRIQKFWETSIYLM